MRMCDCKTKNRKILRVRMEMRERKKLRVRLISRMRKIKNKRMYVTVTLTFMSVTKTYDNLHTNKRSQNWTKTFNLFGAE